MDFSKQLQWTTKSPQFWNRCCCDCCDKKEVKDYQYLKSEIVDGNKVDFWGCKSDKKGDNRETDLITIVYGERDFYWISKRSYSFSIKTPLIIELLPEMYRLQKEYYGV